MKSIKEPQRDIPVALETDVVVAGGGPSGFIGALAAARNGAKVVVIEKSNYIGGLLTCLPMNAFYGYQGIQLVRGIPEEFVQRLIEAGACLGHTVDARLGSSTCTDPEMLKVVTQQMLEEAGVQLLFHTMVVAPVMEGNKIRGVIVENKSGRQAILGKVVLDATGDGDVAAWAGAPFEIKERKKMQPGTLMFSMDHVNVDKLKLAVVSDPTKVIMAKKQDVSFFLESKAFVLDGFTDEIKKAKENGDLPPDYPQTWLIVIVQPRQDQVLINNAMVINFHSTDAFDLTKAEMLARKRIPVVVKFLKDYIPGFERAVLTSSHGVIGVRESRRIIGEYMLTTEDVLANKSFADGIMVSPWRPATGHNPDGNLADDTYPRESITGCEVPYRCLVPKEIEMLLLTGRCISTSGEAQNAIRNMPPCMGLAQAAGTAAAVALTRGVKPRDIDVTELRERLIQQGAYLGAKE